MSACPLANCRWESDPVEQVDAASEAFRAHLSAHGHSDLVQHVHAIGMTVTRYERKPE